MAVSRSFLKLICAGRRSLVAGVLAALVLAAVPATTEAQSRIPKQRARITAADRKAAAEARKAKMEAWKKSGAGHAAPSHGKGGGR